MANSGYKNWLTLKKYVNGVATSETKTNASSDPNYIAPVLDTENCPTTSNTCPTVTSAISDISVTVGATNQVINLNNVFNDTDGDTLTYTATSSNTNVASVSIDVNNLTIVFAGSTGGSSTINVTASDGTCSATDSFIVTLTEVSQACNTGLTQLSLFNGTTSEEACSVSVSNIDIVYANNTSITTATVFYDDIYGCDTSAKFLSDGTNWVQINSSGTKIDSGLCATQAACPSYFTGSNYSEVSESQPYLRLGGLCTTENQTIYYSEAWIDISGAGTNVPTYYSLSEAQSISLGCPISPIGYNGDVMSGGTYTGDGGTITVASGNTLINHGYIWSGNSTYVADNGWTVFSEWDDYGIVNVFFMPNCETAATPPTAPPTATAYTGLTRCDNNSVTWYTNHEVQHADGTYKQLSSGSSFYSAGQVCYISTGTTYDISGKTFIDGTGYNPYSGGPCDCDCYNYNC